MKLRAAHTHYYRLIDFDCVIPSQTQRIAISEGERANLFTVL